VKQEESTKPVLSAVDVWEHLGKSFRTVAYGSRRLSPGRSEALALRLFGELEMAEIAQVMGRRETAVRVLIFPRPARSTGMIRRWQPTYVRMPDLLAFFRAAPYIRHTIFS
jgi:hypothetical protein